MDLASTFKLEVRFRSYKRQFADGREEECKGSCFDLCVDSDRTSFMDVCEELGSQFQWGPKQMLTVWYIVKGLDDCLKYIELTSDNEMMRMFDMHKDTKVIKIIAAVLDFTGPLKTLPPIGSPTPPRQQATFSRTPSSQPQSSRPSAATQLQFGSPAQPMPFVAEPSQPTPETPPSTPTQPMPFVVEPSQQTQEYANEGQVDDDAYEDWDGEEEDEEHVAEVNLDDDVEYFPGEEWWGEDDDEYIPAENQEDNDDVDYHVPGEQEGEHEGEEEGEQEGEEEQTEIVFDRENPCIDVGSLFPNGIEFRKALRYFTVQRFRAAYAGQIYAMTGKDQWLAGEPGFHVHPPLQKRPPGRPRKQRFKGCNELGKKRQRCKRCSQLGHQARTCKEPIGIGPVPAARERKMYFLHLIP